ncbi:hypothetical protein OK016_06225 [Vibrio chagasii]|nr:hypothetical protein [Vibrio chagasii]
MVLIASVALAGDNAFTTDESQVLEQKHLDAEPDLMVRFVVNHASRPP